MLSGDAVTIASSNNALFQLVAYGVVEQIIYSNADVMYRDNISACTGDSVGYGS